jgi:hypothetical protein
VKGEDLIRKINAMLRYHFKIDPDLLDDEDWLLRWRELQWVLNFEKERVDSKDNLEI